MNYPALGLIAFAVLAALWAQKVLSSLDKINEQIGNVRFYLGTIEERMQRVNDKLHAIEAHTNRAVKEAYDEDDWRDRQPPI